MAFDAPSLSCGRFINTSRTRVRAFKQQPRGIPLKRFLAGLATFVAAVSMMGAMSSSASADYNFCGPAISSGGAYSSPGDETCEMVYYKDAFGRGTPKST